MTIKHYSKRFLLNPIKKYLNPGHRELSYALSLLFGIFRNKTEDCREISVGHNGS